MEQRVVSLEYLRGVAALGVAVGHLTWAVFSEKALAGRIGADLAAEVLAIPKGFPPPWLILPGADYFVNCFFLLSGFVIEKVITSRPTSPAQFAVSRCFRIYPVMFVAVAMGLLGQWYAGNDLPDALSIVGEALLINGYRLTPQAWTLIIEMHFYAATALFLLLRVKVAAKTAILDLALVLCLSAALIGIEWAPSGAMGFALTNLFWLAWINTGALVYHLWKSQTVKHFWLLALHLFAVFVAFKLIAVAPSAKWVFPNLNPAVFSAAFATLMLLVLGEKFMPNVPPLEFLARISYSLYALHIAVGWLVFSIAFPLAGIGIAMLLSVSGAILAAVLAHFWLEAPANTFGKRLAAKLGEASFVEKPRSQAMSPQP